MTQNDRLFKDINAEEQQCTEIESLCMQCHENGMTRLLLTKIPHFKEVVLMAFECPHCGTRNNEIQSADTISEHGVTYTCHVDTKEDLNRQIIKTEQASISFQELEFEIPPNTQRGMLNTIEGFLMKAIGDLGAEQAYRKENDPVVWERIEALLKDLTEMCEGRMAFTVVVDDPSGNSYIENLCAPQNDPKLSVKHYKRTAEQCEAIGLDFEAEQAQQKRDEEQQQEMGTDEVISFPTNCPECKVPCETRMKIFDIPHFKEVVIMATTCDSCGYRTNEVKSGSEVAEKGRRVILKVLDRDDFSRDILKSETCALRIPEIDLELDAGTLGGRFTTIEGMLQLIYDELHGKLPFHHGDSTESGRKDRIDAFLEKLRKVLNLEVQFTLILDDPLGNSYMQNIYAPDADPNMSVEEYERSWEQNEFLGFNDMNTETYQMDTVEEAEPETED